MLCINKEVEQQRLESYQQIKSDNVYLIFSPEHSISVDITTARLIRSRCQKSADLVIASRELKLGRDTVDKTNNGVYRKDYVMKKNQGRMFGERGPKAYKLVP